MFDGIPEVPAADELVEKALKRAVRAKRASRGSKNDRERILVTVAANIISDTLRNIVRGFPNLDRIHPFYRETLDVLVGVDAVKVSLASLDWASDKVRSLSKEYSHRIRWASEREAATLRREALGRMISIVERIDRRLGVLRDARGLLRRLPAVGGEGEGEGGGTAVVAGYANVGKSSFVARVSTAKPEIATYPFTTKSVSVGHIFEGGERYVIIDTPGLLDRPLSERNKIELQAISALKHLADVIVFILDPSETCGYPVERQLRLLREVRAEFRAPMLIVLNKMDLLGTPLGASMRANIEKIRSEVPEFYEVSTLTGENLDAVKEKLLEMLRAAKRAATT
ncbi:MAG: NOG1 family protein [Candidatus Alkanophagales archaeon]